MKKLIDTIRNIFKIEELRNRILYTLGLLLIYRLGSFVVLPGLNPEALSGSGLQKQTADGILGLLDIFSGGRSPMPPFSRWGSCPTSRRRS